MQSLRLITHGDYPDMVRPIFIDRQHMIFSVRAKSFLKQGLCLCSLMQGLELSTQALIIDYIDYRDVVKQYVLSV